MSSLWHSLFRFSVCVCVFFYSLAKCVWLLVLARCKQNHSLNLHAVFSLSVCRSLSLHFSLVHSFVPTTSQIETQRMYSCIKQPIMKSFKLLITYRLTFLCASADRYGYFLRDKEIDYLSFSLHMHIFVVVVVAYMYCWTICLYNFSPACSPLLSSNATISVVVLLMSFFSFASTHHFIMVYCILIYLFNLISIVFACNGFQCLYTHCKGTVRASFAQCQNENKTERERKHYTNNKTQHFLTLIFFSFWPR